jgi:hypothetical protein
MKNFFASLTFVSILFQSTSAMAWVGGPYSNNTPDGKSGGVFQGTISMKNGSGMFRFATGSEPFISPNANSVIFHEGLVYYGDCFGMVDFQAKRISGITNGLTDFDVNNGAGGSGNITPIGTPAFIFGNSATGFFVCNTEWAGKINKTAPGVTFKAKGYAYVFDGAGQNVTTTSITTESAANVDLPNDTGTVTTTTVQTIVSNEPAEKTKLKIKVYGSRVSTIAYTSFGAATPTP